MDKRLLTEARRARAGLLLAALLQLAAGLCLIAGSFALARVIAHAFLDHAPLDQLAAPLLLVAGFALARAICAWGAHVAAADLSIRVRLDLRRRLLTHLAALGASFVQGERTGDLVATTSKGIDSLDPYFRDYLPALITAVLVPLATLAVVLPLDALTFVVLLLTAPLIPLFMALIGMAAGALAKRQYAEMSFLSAHFLDVMQGLTTLRLFNRSRHQIDTIARFSGEFRAATMGVLRVAFLSALA
ncbi:MAG: thiol reductant ABC exporter subunit CydD, partial [Anaerolineae bacterium]|nr:thiol reductant ABC exporter subunit CydD [Anaerolineae bacterium]